MNILKMFGINTAAESLVPLQAPAPQAEAVSTTAQEALALTATRDATLVANRRPLIDYLAPYVTLDERGYPVRNAPHSLDRLTKDVDGLAQRFGQVANGGDAGYAHDIRTFLAGEGIRSPQVAKGNPAARLDQDESIRPASYVDRDITGKDLDWQSYKAPPHSAYIDLWGNAIWEGYKQYRERTFQLPLKRSESPKVVHKIPGQDSAITPAQMANYEAAVCRIHALHQEGWLLGRVATVEEISSVIGHRLEMSSNDILSTTLLPCKDSMIEMTLFHDGAPGILLDPSRARCEDLGLAIPKDIGTSGSGFINHKNPWGEKGPNLFAGVNDLRAQHELLQNLEAIAQFCGNTDNLRMTISFLQGLQWEIHNEWQQREGKIGRNKVRYNEITYYRGITGDLVTGLFVNRTASFFAEDLAALFIVQDHIRRTKGLFLPIFELDLKNNQLHELPPNDALLKIAGLATSRIQPIERLMPSLPKEEKSGIKREDFLQIRCRMGSFYATQIVADISDSIEFQLWLLAAEATHATRIKIIENRHLFFPTGFSRRSLRSYMGGQGSVRSSSDWVDFKFNRSCNIDKSQRIELQQLDSWVSPRFSILLRKSIQKILGITVTPTGDVHFVDKRDDFFRVSLPQGFDTDLHFAKTVSRAMQAALIFEVFGDNTKGIVWKIVDKIRKQIPDLGYVEDTSVTKGWHARLLYMIIDNMKDMILESPEMQKMVKFNSRLKEKRGAFPKIMSKL